MYHVGGYPFAGGWLLGLLVFAGLILLIAWGVAWILRRDSRHYGAPLQPPPMPPTSPPPVDPALQIVRERFARGEISEADFVAASRVLGAPSPPPDRAVGPQP